MSERKVLNKYYPPDFDPSKIPRMKLPKNRQYTVRLMAPFNMRCKTCGEYIYKGKKFNARKEDVENEDYFGIRIYRFYIKCTRCLQEISFKTDPKNTDYEIEAGATRNFMALKLAEEQALREEEEAKEEEANNPMKLLENRTKQSKNEIELLESLEELKDLNRRQEAVDYDTMLSAYDPRISQREREEKLKQMDEEYIKSIKFQSSSKRKIVVEEHIIEDDQPPEKTVKEENSHSSQTTINLEDMKDTKQAINSSLHDNSVTSSSRPVKTEPSWNKSVGVLSKKGRLSGLVKVKKTNEPVPNNLDDRSENDDTSTKSESSEKLNSVVAKPSASLSINKVQNSLSLLGAYSDSSDNSEDE